jgi:CheY-like chemotaxis protein
VSQNSAPISVLIVEDDPLWRRIIRHTLSKQNVQLIEAETVGEALDALDRQAFDVVVADFELPDGCGLDILDTMERERLGRLVLASGFVDAVDLQDDRAVEVDRFLTKPFLSSDLTACLEGLGVSDSAPGALRAV